MRALVVDDEPPALSELTYLLEQDGRFSAVVPAASGTDALRALEAGPVDVVFSDISMPGLDGMELARVIARFADRPQIVFVTAHDEHAVDAFAVHATDYVMKPVSAARLAQAVDRVVAGRQRADDPAARTGGAAGPARPQVDPQPPVAPAPRVQDERIAVELGGVTRFVQRSAIRYVQAQGDYVRLFTATGSHLLRTPMATLEERWARAGFVRIHRSTLVSLAHVAEVRQSHGKLSLVLAPDGTELPVARRHVREVRERVLGA
ncbi:LytTR family DNA-binding domain-containing protein [Ornithinimicrobium humiphilum]|uniref:LytTR family two component transcriptional regulator n=1 Tax=Ornithinimicrobium humiphilum TaxID=125288 RepID=A0A543K6Q6_9MICO|nr:LytTR family DNA-binding domain-containing protein [Ornithinimicrobium humiphilum]TQM90768.1 LytTR family two component transcriptional regulator [Ornithinimicrobium humiphilum]